MSADALKASGLIGYSRYKVYSSGSSCENDNGHKLNYSPMVLW